MLHSKKSALLADHEHRNQKSPFQQNCVCFPLMACARGPDEEPRAFGFCQKKGVTSEKEVRLRLSQDLLNSYYMPDTELGPVMSEGSPATAGVLPAAGGRGKAGTRGCSCWLMCEGAEAALRRWA